MQRVHLAGRLAPLIRGIQVHHHDNAGLRRHAGDGAVVGPHQDDLPDAVVGHGEMGAALRLPLRQDGDRAHERIELTGLERCGC